jgi:helix-turn-helix protein
MPGDDVGTNDDVVERARDALQLSAQLVEAPADERPWRCGEQAGDGFGRRKDAPLRVEDQNSGDRPSPFASRPKHRKQIQTAVSFNRARLPISTRRLLGTAKSCQMPEPAYLTLSQVSLRTGRHPELLRQWCARGRIPCARVGGSWVLREQDLGFVDGIARRNHQTRAGPMVVDHPERSRIIAAVFDDDGIAGTVADALRDRLRLAHDAVGTTSLGLTGLAPLRLSVVAGRFSEPGSVDARRILVGYGGRIVADIDEAAAAAGQVRFGTTRSRRHDDGRRGRGEPQRPESTEAGGRVTTRAVPR